MADKNKTYRDNITGKPVDIENAIDAFQELNKSLKKDSFDSVSFLQKLIQSSSVTPNTADSTDLCKKQFEKMGFTTETMVFINDKNEEVINLVASYGNGEPHTVISGHLDVVPAGDAKEWTLSNGDPFAGNIIKNENGEEIIVGRGAVDMKGPIVSAIGSAVDTIEMYPDGQENFPGKFTFILSGDEETGGFYGTRLVLEELEKRGEKIDQCLVAEPSSREHNCDEGKIGSRGIMRTDVHLNEQQTVKVGNVTIKVDLEGKQGHTGHSGDANNPLWHQARLIKTLANPVTVDGQKITVVPVSANGASHARNVSPEVSSVTFSCNLDAPEKIKKLNKEIEKKIEQSKNPNGHNNAKIKVSYEYNSECKPCDISKDSENNPLYRVANIVAASEKTLDKGNEHFTDATQMVPTSMNEKLVLFDCRYTDEFDSETLQKGISDRLLDANNGSKGVEKIDFYNMADVFYSAPEKEINAICDSIAAATGRQPNKVTSGGGSDMRFFKCPAIEIGPRDATIHAVNEQIPVAALKEVRRIYSRVMGDICRDEQARRLGVNTDELPADKIDKLKKIRTILGADESSENKDILYIKSDSEKGKIVVIENDDTGSAIKEAREQLDSGSDLQILHIPKIEKYNIEGSGQYWQINDKNKQENFARFAHQYSVLHRKVANKDFADKKLDVMHIATMKNGSR
ncbi:MAG: M20/M25/M40 family metallo-hydrolase [Alphaproteobacteria bacterium]|nr:M20/M25/M40 family metallo-hydrolase [Alphaproteobacteria bacterium]